MLPLVLSARQRRESRRSGRTFARRGAQRPPSARRSIPGRPRQSLQGPGLIRPSSSRTAAQDVRVSRSASAGLRQPVLRQPGLRQPVRDSAVTGPPSPPWRSGSRASSHATPKRRRTPLTRPTSRTDAATVSGLIGQHHLPHCSSRTTMLPSAARSRRDAVPAPVRRSTAPHRSRPRAARPRRSAPNRERPQLAGQPAGGPGLGIPLQGGPQHDRAWPVAGTTAGRPAWPGPPPPRTPGAGTALAGRPKLRVFRAPARPPAATGRDPFTLLPPTTRDAFPCGLDVDRCVLHVAPCSHIVPYTGGIPPSPVTATPLLRRPRRPRS